jgi:hypothetical protein
VYFVTCRNPRLARELLITREQTWGNEGLQRSRGGDRPGGGLGNCN